MREHIPATTPPAQKTKIEEILDRDAQANKALIGNSTLLGGAAAALSYAEREARSKNSYLARPTERS